MADNLYLPQVDYTSRDYESIRDDLIALIPNFTPQWKSTADPNDFGIVLIELFSYIGDLLNYQIDRAANETYLNTSTQRDTVIAIAKLLNYIPNDTNPASGTVTFSNYNNSIVSIPTGTEVATTSDGVNPSISFITTSATAQVPVATGVNLTTPGTVSVAVTQGKKVTDEVVGVSDGSGNQYFALSNSGVITSSGLTVTVGSLAYTKVSFLIDYGADDPVFSTFTDGAGTTYILFGDAESGRIPPKDTTIKVSYVYSPTAGSLGNVAADKVNTIVNVPGGSVPANVTVTNPTAFSGGADPESTDSIRVNAPASLRSLNRAVSLSDYGQLALQVNGVSKAIAMATTFANVVLYIAAAGGSTTTDTFKTTVSNYFVDKTPPGASVRVLDFTPVYPYLNITVNVLPQYSATNVGAAVADALYSLFAFDNVTFNDLITQGDVQAVAKSVDGVGTVTINDYEKLPALYSQRAATTATATSSTSISTTITVDSTAGLWVGAALSSITNTTGGVIYSYTTPLTTITSITATTNQIVISTTPTAISIPSGSTIVVQGNAGVSDLVCAVSEVPVLNTSYITVNTSGGNT